LAAQPRNRRDAPPGGPGHRLQLDDSVVLEAVGDEELHRDRIAGIEVAEREVRPLLGGVEIHVDLGEDEVPLLQEILQPDDFAHAVMGPVQESEQALLARMAAGAAGEDDLVVEIALDEGRVVARVEQLDIVRIVHGALLRS
jgi:hypothetical protein